MQNVPLEIREAPQPPWKHTCNRTLLAQCLSPPSPSFPPSRRFQSTWVCGEGEELEFGLQVLESDDRLPWEHRSIEYGSSISLCERSKKEILFSCLSATSATRHLIARYQRKRVLHWHVSYGVDFWKHPPRQDRMSSFFLWISFAHYDRPHQQLHLPKMRRGSASPSVL